MTEDQRKQILVEAVKRFGRQEWFRNATVYDSHPMTGDAVLEIKVNYVPIFERKVVMDFALSVNLREKFVVVDKNGNPAE
jgi:hypothetical protein